MLAHFGCVPDVCDRCVPPALMCEIVEKTVPIQIEFISFIIYYFSMSRRAEWYRIISFSPFFGSNAIEHRYQFVFNVL